MMPPKPRVIHCPENHVKIGGWYKAKQEADKTIQGKAPGMYLKIFKDYCVLEVHISWNGSPLLLKPL